MNAPAADRVCSYCQSTLAEGDSVVTCPACAAGYHAECWQENGGCAVYGCRQTPATEARTAMEVPVSWWGQENKPCPSCSQQILAAALRCRHCGATFASARPENRDEYRQRTSVVAEQPGLRTKVIWCFALSCVPLSAVVGAAMSWKWYWPNRTKVETLPTIYPALARLGLVVSTFQVVAFIGFAVIYGLLR